MGNEQVTLFTDGGCIGNPGPGGWGAIRVEGERYEELGGTHPETTNNRMEMTAALEGLKFTGPGQTVRVVTDSRYLIDGITKWIHGWKKKGWKKSNGDGVLNRDLWEALDHEVRQRSVKWEHVAGHAGHPENERCDDIANGFARGNGPELLSGDGAWIFQGVKKAATKKGAPKKNVKKKDPPKSEVPYAAPIYLSMVKGAVEEHENWSACEARIKGVKGAKCKKVRSRTEHIATINDWGDEA